MAQPTSNPFISSSIMILSSYVNAKSIALLSLPLFDTLVIPKELPAFNGLTNIG